MSNKNQFSKIKLLCSSGQRVKLKHYSPWKLPFLIIEQKNNFNSKRFSNLNKSYDKREGNQEEYKSIRITKISPLRLA